MPMQVVTGAAGHLGNVLVRELLSQQAHVRAVILPNDPAIALTGLPVAKVFADVRDLEALKAAFKGADTVFHLAGIVSVIPGQLELLRQVNITGTSNVIQACLESNVRRLVYASSVHALLEPPLGTALDETYPFAPQRVHGDYGKTKAQASLNVLAGAQRGLDVVICCPSGLMGPHDYQPSIVGRLVQTAARGKLHAYVPGGYDFVDVRDAAAGLIAASKKGRTGETYILSGEYITIEQVVTTVNSIIGKRYFSVRVPLKLALWASRLAERMHLLGDNGAHFTQQALHVLQSNGQICHAKATRELAYQPRPIEQAIRDSLAWFNNEDSIKS